MRLVLVIGLFLIIFSPLHATTLRLVTGEFAPYVSEKLPDGGVSAQVVKAVFGELKQDVSVEFIPWNRAMNYLKSGIAAGSFPWAKNDEREKDLLYSDPIHKYRLLSFVKKGFEKKFNPAGKKVCLPSGWDLATIEKNVEKYKMSLERPINMESCFRMLALGRVDVIVLSEHAGYDLIKILYPKDTPIVVVDSEILGNISYLYFLVPKNYPNAKKIIADFNHGLGVIKKNGKYDKLVNVLLRKESSTAICETCNRLGSL